MSIIVDCDAPDPKPENKSSKWRIITEELDRSNDIAKRSYAMALEYGVLVKTEIYVSGAIGQSVCYAPGVFLIENPDGSWFIY